MSSSQIERALKSNSSCLSVYTYLVWMTPWAQGDFLMTHLMQWTPGWPRREASTFIQSGHPYIVRSIYVTMLCYSILIWIISIFPYFCWCTRQMTMKILGFPTLWPSQRIHRSYFLKHFICIKDCKLVCYCILYDFYFCGRTRKIQLHIIVHIL